MKRAFLSFAVTVFTSATSFSYAATCQDLFSQDSVSGASLSRLFVQDRVAVGTVSNAVTRPGSLRWTRTDIRKDGDARALVKTGIFTSDEGSTKGLQLVVDHSRPVGRDRRRISIILLHGVLDKRQDLDALTYELVKRGFDVFRADLLAHGDTAKVNRAAMDGKGPVDYRKQIQILKAFALKAHEGLRMDGTIVMGHSLGGGLSMPLAEELKAAGMNVWARVPLMPYLSAIDKFLREHRLSTDVLKYRNDQIQKKFGGASANSSSPQMWQIFTRAMTEHALIMSSVSQIGMSGSLTTAFMETLFRQYVEQKNEALPKGSKMKDAEIDFIIRGGIDATQGVSTLDFQDRTHPTELDPTIPTFLVWGDADDIVIPPQVADFEVFAKEKGYDITFEKMPGDHFRPQQQPVDLADRIMHYLTTRGLIP